MVWRSDTKPTPAAIRKRLKAAREAVQAAQDLAAKHGPLGARLAAPCKNAIGWLDEAIARTGGRHG